MHVHVGDRTIMDERDFGSEVSLAVVEHVGRWDHIGW